MDNECIICFESLNKYKLIILSCNHKYHYHCLQPWINKKKTLVKLCPICENDVEIINIIDSDSDSQSEIQSNSDSDSQSDSDSDSRTNIHQPFRENNQSSMSCCCYL